LNSLKYVNRITEKQWIAENFSSVLLLPEAAQRPIVEGIGLLVQEAALLHLRHVNQKAAR
jgi:hypothetical protein